MKAWLLCAAVRGCTGAAASLLAISAASAAPLFEAPFLGYDAGLNCVGVADLNQDGLADVVSGGSTGTLGHTLVRLAHQDGTLGGAVGYRGSPYDAAFADFDGDGTVDIMTTGRFDITRLLLGNGNGTFRTSSQIAVNGSALVQADLNKDGRSDLVIGGDGKVSVLLGTGPATFGSATNFAIDAIAVAVADLNGDGNIDIVVISPTTATGSILLGHGDGAFAAPTTVSVGVAPLSVAIGDVDQDGYPDLVVTSFGSTPTPGSLSLLRGNGDGTFQPRTDLLSATRTTWTAIGDLNGDGLLDIVAVVHSSPEFRAAVLLGTGNGSFAPSLYEIAYGKIALGDLNGDGYLDIVTSGISVLYGNGNGTFGHVRDFPTSLAPRAVAMGDLNGDGYADLAVVNTGSATLSLLQGNGDATFGSATELVARNGACAVAIADLDADGHLDLVIANNSAESISVLMNQGAGTFAPLVNYGAASVQCIAVGDFNEDGRPDVIVGSPPLRSLFVYLGNGDGTFAPESSFRVDVGVYSIALGDIDKDGHLDVAVMGGPILLGQGNGGFAPPQGSYTLGGSGRWVALADVNSDGNLDIIDASPDLNTSSYWPGHGDGSFGSLIRLNGPGNVVSAADLDGDGDLDLVFVNSLGPRVLFGDRTGRFGRIVQFGNGNGVDGLAVGDVNEDGRPDLVVANPNANTVSVLVNTGASVPVDATAVSASGFLAHSTPNPALRELTVHYSLAAASELSLRIYDVRGRFVRTLVSGPTSAGAHRVLWNLRSAKGARVAPGVYFYELRANGARFLQRAVIAR